MDYNRWLVPPAALAIHLAIGQVYAFSVFKLPLTKVIGITASADGDWTQTDLAYIFSIAIVFLGLSAAFAGRWLEDVGPRRAMFTSACCFGGGFLLSAIGVYLHQIFLLYLGYGALGGIGLGIGYVSPVSTLIKWFPDRPGMATGLAIMGFGGGAMIGSPLSTTLMSYFQTPTSVGVLETFVTMGIIYLVFMMFGVFAIRLPAPGWKPAGFVASNKPQKLITTHNMDVSDAVRTPQFYMLWVVLCLNVTAGIGILETASPMIQDMFPGSVKAAAAGGFVGLLSLFNMGGRFFWSSMSDYIGRRNTYMVFFTLGIVLYASIPTIGHLDSPMPFVVVALIAITMYGGGFAAIPAYLRDLFGTMHVGAIHGRLLTAWAAAGVIGPLLVNYLRDYQISQGVPKADAYGVTMYVMAVLLAIGFISNFMVTAVSEKRIASAKSALTS
jgi:MFS family permease